MSISTEHGVRMMQKFLGILFLLLSFQISATEVVRYNFNNSDATDSSGQNNNGTLQGAGCSFVDGRGGKVLNLNKTSQCWVSLPSNLIRSNPQFTISMWFKTTSPGGLFGYSNADVNNSVNQFVPILSVRNDGKLYGEMWVGSSMNVISSNVVNDGQWHNVVMTSNSSSIRVYLDGVDIGGANGVPQHLSMTFNYLGVNNGRGRTSQGAGWNFFDGQIDELIIRTDALSAEDIAIPTYTITYDGNGASAGTAPANGKKLKDVGLTIAGVGDLVRANHLFTGWNTDPAGTGTSFAAGAEYTANENVTLYAQWQTTNVNLTFDSAGGSEVAAMSQVPGSALTPPQNPTRLGYKFVKWSPDLPGVVPNVDLRFTAQWELAMFQLSIDANGGDAIAPMMLAYDSDVKVSVPVRTGYTFVGWTPEVPSKMPAQNVNLKAQWKVNQYQITFNTDGGVAIPSRLVNFGSALTLPVPVRSGYLFKGWSPAAPTTMPAQNITLTATWEANSAKVTSSGSSLGFFSSLGLALLVLVRRFGKIMLLIAPALASFAANANQSYMGIQLGNAKNESSEDLGVDVSNKMQQKGIAGNATLMQNSDQSYRLYAGFPINAWLSAEFAWVDLGQAELKYNNLTPKSEAMLIKVQPLRGRGLEASMVAKYPLSDVLTGMGRIGLMQSENIFLFDGPTMNQKVTDRSFVPAAEIGLSYNVVQHVDVTFSTSIYDTDNYATTQWMLGVKFSF